MKKLKVSILIIVSIFISLIYTNVYAGSVDVSFSGNDTYYVGDTVELTVKVSNVTSFTNGLATLQADIGFDEGYLEYVKAEDVSSDLSVSYGVKTKRFVALGMSGEYVASSGNLLKLTFKAKTPGKTTVSLTNTVVGDTSAIVHTANVSNKPITILKAGDDPAPTPAPDSGDKKDSGGKSSGGNSGGSKSTTPTSKTDTNKTKSSDATLSKLFVNNSKMSPSFSSSVTSYKVEVANEVSKAEISFETTDPKAKAEIIGNTSLSDGTNIIQVSVTAEDGTKKIYTLNVTRLTEASNTKLLLLNVAEADKLDFDEDTYSYKINVGSNVKKLTVNAIPKSKGSKVTILGNGKLSTGSNMVVIKVTDKNGFSSYYKLNVKKSDKVKLFGIDILYWFLGLFGILFLLLLILFLLKRRDDDDDEDTKTIKLEVVGKDEENKDIYDDIVTKDEIIEAIEEKNPKKLKMLLTQEEANRLKDELKEAEKKDEKKESE